MSNKLPDTNRQRMQEMLDAGYVPLRAQSTDDALARIADNTERIAVALERLAYGVVMEP